MIKIDAANQPTEPIVEIYNEDNELIGEATTYTYGVLWIGALYKTKETHLIFGPYPAKSMAVEAVLKHYQKRKKPGWDDVLGIFVDEDKDENTEVLSP